jgi:hypothetical protein
MRGRILSEPSKEGAPEWIAADRGRRRGARPLVAASLGTAALLVVASCAAPRYQADGESSRFTVTQEAPDMFRVVFDGSAWTATERARDFALLRASEVVLNHGFAYFALSDAGDGATPAQTDASASFQRTPYVAGNTVAFSDSRRSSSRADLLVRAFRSKPADTFAYEAAPLRQTLRQRYGIE